MSRISAGPRLKDVAFKNQMKTLGTQFKRRSQAVSNKGSKGGSQGTSNSTSLKSCSIKNGRKFLIDKNKPSEIANEVWSFGKALGLQSDGNEVAVLQRLERMEERDRRDARRGEGSKGGC